MSTCTLAVDNAPWFEVDNAARRVVDLDIASWYAADISTWYALGADDMPDLNVILGALDRLDGEPKATVSLVSAALWYVQEGLRVFALRAGSKVPHAGSRGLHDATTDPDTIREMWRQHPDSNIGLATGHRVDVIDIDGPTGVKSWSRLIETGALPPVLGVVSTPRPGGNHLYIEPTGAGNKAALLPGLDFRGAGGYAVAPPSANAGGIRYRWDRPLVP